MAKIVSLREAIAATSPPSAGACGADGYTVASPDEFRAHLAAAVRNRRLAVIDVPMVNEPVPTPGYWNITDIYSGGFD